MKKDLATEDTEITEAGRADANAGWVIGWRALHGAAMGRGKKVFTNLEQAEAMADELNRSYPAFEHEATSVAATREDAKK